MTEETTMTKETVAEIEALKALLPRGLDYLVLAEMLGFMADRLISQDADQLCAAVKHERNADRAKQRNGYQPRAGNTDRAGKSEDTESAQGVLFPRVPGTPARCRDCHGHDRRLQEQVSRLYT